MNTVPKLRLQKIAEELGGTVVYVTCSDKTTTHQKIVIDYGHQKKTKRLALDMAARWIDNLTKLYVSYIICKETLRSVS